MKRPPGLWLLLSAGVLWLSMQDVYGIRATALIFGRSTTTTSTTSESPASEESLIADNKTDTSSGTSTSSNSTSSASNSTKTLSGIPQIDYIYDPNLPRELNGYNLSEYPFYHRVPAEDIEFKCDGLHDGFYASVPHKCQVYHHCLFGTRYDFLCANYTAFDQKTFICHFVSEVDCINSPKFWHRNDALYQAASTTTPKPPPPPSTTAPPPPSPPDSSRPSGPGGARRRKPFRRPRPQYDYYDDEDYEQDYYEPPPPRQRNRRKRPRPRPRPVYEDEYDEEYEDDRYERRGSGRRGTGERDRDRRPYDDDKYNKKRPYDDRRRKEEGTEQEEDRRPSKNEDRRHEKRRPTDERNYETPKRNEKPPKDDDFYEDEPRINSRPKKTKYVEDNEEELSRNNGDKPIVKPLSGGSVYGQPRKAPRIRPPVPKTEQNKYNYKAGSNSKATTTTLSPPKQVEDPDYNEDEEELPPSRSNNRPNTQRPKGSQSERSEVKEKQAGYGSRPRGNYRKPANHHNNDEDVEDERPKTRRPQRYRPNGRNGSSRKRPPVDDDYVYEDEMEAAKSQSQKSTRTDTREEIKDQTTKMSQKAKESQVATETTERSITSTAAKSEPVKSHHHQPSYVRVVKRPFLPSRGGNPYSSRGLKPVGAKYLEEKQTQKEENYSEIKDDVQPVELEEEIQTEEDQKPEDNKPLTSKPTTTEVTTHPPREENTEKKIVTQYRPVSINPPPQVNNQRSNFKPSPQIADVPTDDDYANEQYIEESEEVIKPIPPQTIPVPKSNLKPKLAEPPRTTSKPYYEDKSSLDITDDEYDVTLNEAINPTLPNLPIRSYPTGFSNAQGFPYNNFQRPRTNQQSFKPSYQIRPTNHGTIIVPNSSPGAYISSEGSYTPHLDEEPQVYRPQNFRPSPQVTQVRTQPYYSY